MSLTTRQKQEGGVASSSEQRSQNRVFYQIENYILRLLTKGDKLARMIKLLLTSDINYLCMLCRELNVSDSCP